MTSRSKIACIFHGQPPAEVAPGLWQSGYPLNPRALSDEGFDLLVLCSEELQGEDANFPVDVLRAPMSDTEDAEDFPRNLRQAYRAALEVAEALGQGKKVLVTCTSGRNRSGLVSSLALMMHQGITGAEAMAKVRAVRHRALTNRLFARYLEWKRA
jgi:protein-tyrosine phosphatase